MLTALWLIFTGMAASSYYTERWIKEEKINHKDVVAFSFLFAAIGVIFGVLSVVYDIFGK